MTSLADLTRAIPNFRGERDWAQFHMPRHLPSAIAIEEQQSFKKRFSGARMVEALAIAQGPGSAHVADEVCRRDDLYFSMR